MNEISIDSKSQTPNRNLDGLAGIVKFGIYSATFIENGPLGEDSQPDPIVEVEGVAGAPHRFRVIYSSDKRYATLSNQVRQYVIDGKTKSLPFEIKIIGPQKGSEGYLAVGTPKGLVVKEFGHTRKGKQIDMPVQKAANVLTGENIYHARCTGYKQGSRDPVMMMYAFNSQRSTKLTGLMQIAENMLVIPLRRDAEQLHADKMLGKAIISGSAYHKMMRQGHYMIVRKQKENKKGNIVSVEPAINILQADEAHNPSGIHIWTLVEGYDVGQCIHNLPIVGAHKGQSDDHVGLAYAKRPSDDDGSLYYKPVVVLEGQRYKGGYIPLVKILANGPKVILARVEE